MLVIAIAMLFSGLLIAGMVEVAEGRYNSDCARLLKWSIQMVRDITG